MNLFQRALKAHIQNTSLLEPKEPPGLKQLVATFLVFAAAVALMVVLGFS